MLMIICMTKESKHCNDALKKHFNKELVMTKEDSENGESSTKFWICDNIFAIATIKLEIIVTSLENVGVLHMQIVISTSI